MTVVMGILNGEEIHVVGPVEPTNNEGVVNLDEIFLTLKDTLSDMIDNSSECDKDSFKIFLKDDDGFHLSFGYRREGHELWKA